MTGSGTGGGQGPPEGSDPEDSEKCPICLSVLSGSELAMPDSCCHVFCLRCLLTWAELQATPSCPIDRRPFTNVYRWDGHLTCVQVPVRRRVVQPEVESYCRRNSQYKTGLSKRAVRQRKVERTVDGKSKGLVRKCNDEDPSSLTRKKVRGAESCSWSPPAFVSLTTTQEIAQSVDDEATMLSHRVERCKTQSCVWFSPAAPISATNTTRESFHPSVRYNRAFPFDLGSSPFSTSSVSASSHFVFEGVVCAITCPKGGEKKGGRATKAAPKQTVSKRSTRGGRTRSEAAVSEPLSPPTSGASDPEASHGAPSRPGRGAQAAGKRKGKQVTNRKASGKRKAPARKKRSAEVISSSNEEEEEEGTTKQDNTTEEEQEESVKPESPVEQQDHEKNGENVDDSEPAAIEETHSDEQSESNLEKDQDEPLINDLSQESSDTQDKTENESEEKVDDVYSPSNSVPNSPDSTSEDNHSVKDEEKEGSPKQEQEDSALSDNEKVPSPKQEEMETDEDDDKDSTEGEDVEKNEILTETEAAKEKTEELKIETVEADDSLPVDNKSPRQSDQSEVVLGSADAISKDEEQAKDKEPEKDTTNLSLAEDMNEVPMDFGSPLSEHGSETPMEKESPAEEQSDDKQKDEEASKSEEKKTVEKQEKDKSPERSRPRRSRFHSPTTSWSPKKDSKDSKRERRSRSRERNGSPNRSTRRSRERERDGDYHRRDRSRERRRRRSRSRSRSRSRNRSYRRGDRSPAGEREERREDRREERREDRREERREERRDERRDERREESPQKNERRGGWWAGAEGRKYGGGRFENGVPNEDSPDKSTVDANPDWVEKQRISSSTGAPRWPDPPRGRGRGGFERGRGRGGGNWSFYNQEDSGDNRWQPRNNFSGTGSGNAAAGSDAYSRFNENRGGRRKETDPAENMDRSGWSSASSWAVRRTLPADVQDYYSKRERGGAGGWNRQEEEQPAAGEPPKPDPPTVPGNAPVPVLVSAHPQLLHHYPALPGARGPVSVSLQPAAPYAMPPSQVPVHLHTAVPLLQVPAVGAQGLPPPPPPPPPMQQGSQTAAAQPDGHSTQMASNMGGFAKPLFSTPTKVTQVAPASSLLPSSTTQPQHHKVQADSSKKEKKQQIQEKAINEVKSAIKPYYQKNEITKEEYKEIVRKAVEKVCHSKSGEVNSSKVANLVKAYVDKYKHARKK